MPVTKELPPQTNHKSWAAAITTFVTVVVAALGFGKMPPGQEVESAAMVISAGLASSVVAGFTTWYKRNSVKALLPTLLLVGFLPLLLGACSTLYGEANTQQREAWLATARYSYVAVPLRNYVISPTADVDIVASLCPIDQSVHDSYKGISAARAVGGDTLDAALAASVSALSTLTLEVFGQLKIPDLSNVKSKSLIWAKVGAESVVEMRAWRKSFIKPKLADFEVNDRDPDAGEWATVNKQADLLHGAIQDACNAI